MENQKQMKRLGDLFTCWMHGGEHMENQKQMKRLGGLFTCWWCWCVLCTMSGCLSDSVSDGDMGSGELEFPVSVLGPFYNKTKLLSDEEAIARLDAMIAGCSTEIGAGALKECKKKAEDGFAGMFAEDCVEGTQFVVVGYFPESGEECGFGYRKYSFFVPYGDGKTEFIGMQYITLDKIWWMVPRRESESTRQ